MPNERAGWKPARDHRPLIGSLPTRTQHKASKKPVATIYSTKKCLPDDRSESETIA
jgi:hypothetical protein